MNLSMFILYNDLLSFFGAIYHYIHIRSLKKRERERETGPSQLSQRLLGLLLGTEKKIGQKLIGAEQIAASVPYSFLKWRIPNFLSSLVVDRREGLGMRMGH